MKGRAEKGRQRNCEISKTSRKQSKDIHTTNVQTDKLQKPSQIGVLQQGGNLESTNVERDRADYKMQITLQCHLKT